MTTPPPYGSTPGQPQGYPGQPGQPAPGYQQGPPSAGQPAYGAQPAYGQQPPPAYPSAPGYPPAAYGPAGFGPAGSRRPGMVTTAAVLAFIWGAFAIIGGLIIIAASSYISSVASDCSAIAGIDANTDAACQSLSGYSTGFKIVTAGLIVVAILLIWGGVVALTGKNGQILVIGAAVYIVLEIIAIIIAVSTSGFVATGIFGIVAPVLMVIFMINPASKAWFKSKGAKTF